jgi:competence protein ComGC
MKTATPSHPPFAFTRVELLVVLAAFALPTLVVVPALANSRPRSSRVICANNLRQIGLAFQLWGNDHNDTLPQEVPVLQGGTRAHPLAVNVWLHLAWISNEVASPNIYLCPSDTGKPAREFSASPDGGYLNPNFLNRATSYFLGYTGSDFANDVDAPIAGDRNVSTASVQSCSRFNTALAIPNVAPAGTTRWTAGLHEVAGNVLIWDGRVVQVNSVGLQSLFVVGDGNGSKHIITPR